jgi:hypothetical protein
VGEMAKIKIILTFKLLLLLISNLSSKGTSSSVADSHQSAQRGPDPKIWNEKGHCNYFICCVSCTVVVLTCFVTCGCFDNYVSVLVVCVLVLNVFCIFVLCFCIVSFMYIYSYLFYLYYCNDYCHSVKIQLQ